MWSPPSPTMYWWCFPSFARGMSGAPVGESFGYAENSVWCSHSQCPSSICWIACALLYGATAISPRLMILSPGGKMVDL